MSDDFFASHRQNMEAIEKALDALSAMAPEFIQREDYSERWFYETACSVVYDNYKLHYLISILPGDKSRWQMRVEAKWLAQETVQIVDQVGNMLNRTLRNHISALTDNPKLVEPIEDAIKRFATFRRVHDKHMRVLQKKLGLSADSKKRELLGFDQDLEAREVVELALGVVMWLSDFGKAITLIISALRRDHGKTPGDA
jgi:hypothetical protein